MKAKNTITILALASVFACGGNGKHGSTINFTRTAVELNSAEILNDSSCKISLAYDRPADAPAYLRDSIERNMQTFFTAWFDVSDNADVEMAAKKYFATHIRRVRENKLPFAPVFELKIMPDDVYQNNYLVSMAYGWTLYEGGAHGNFGKYCFTLDKKDGSRLTIDRIIKSGKKDEFISLAETEFKKQSGMKADEKLYSLYRFENDRFHLSKTFALTPAALVFYYNPYEIAPYSAGLIQLSLPYEQFGQYLNFMPK
jgi:hypothetical protein